MYSRSAVSYATRIADVVCGNVEAAPNVGFVVAGEEHALSIPVQLLRQRKLESRPTSRIVCNISYFPAQKQEQDGVHEHLYASLLALASKSRLSDETLRCFVFFLRRGKFKSSSKPFS